LLDNRTSIGSNGLFVDIFGTLVMIDGAKISILHPCPTSEGIADDHALGH
jgi:hypothetical protein